MGSYLTEIQRAGIEPNHYCSAEYLARAEAVERHNDEHLWMEDPATGYLFFPALRWTGKGFVLSDWTPKNKKIWSDFHGWMPEETELWKTETLDMEYMYNPCKFTEKRMVGKKWATFRKNARKWPRRNGVGMYRSLMGPRGPVHAYQNEINELLLNWIANKGAANVHDGDILVDYVTQGYNRAVLIDKRGVVGINVWDYTYCTINYRCCICRADEPFLSDYMRLLFYQSIAVYGKMVNDGGSLDSDGLDNYKRKLNPSRIRPVRSWRRKLWRWTPKY